MSFALIYAISALLICFTLSTFFLSRLQTDIYPEDYEFQYDPFWIIISVLLIGGSIAFYFFPEQYDSIQSYSLLHFLLPPIFGGIIYFIYLLGFPILTHLIILGFSLSMTPLLPESFYLFPEYLLPWQDRCITAILLYLATISLPLLNCIGGLASLQFIVITTITFILSYFNYIPTFFMVISAVYFGVMMAFLFYSWPPEKLIMSQGAFLGIGFVAANFLLLGACEYADGSVFIASSFMFTELMCALYNRFIFGNATEYLFMNTYSFRISQEGKYELVTIQRIIKIFVINGVLAVIQVFAPDRLALPLFSILLNLWFLSILSGDTKPEQLLSVTDWSKKSIKKLLVRKNNKKKDSD